MPDGEEKFERQRQNFDWPVYFICEGPSFVRFIEIFGPNGPARETGPEFDPELISMFDLASMAGASDSFMIFHRDKTPFRFEGVDRDE